MGNKLGDVPLQMRPLPPLYLPNSTVGNFFKKVNFSGAPCIYVLAGVYRGEVFVWLGEFLDCCLLDQRVLVGVEFLEKGVVEVIQEVL